MHYRHAALSAGLYTLLVSAMGCLVATAGGSVLDRWSEAMRAKRWVTAFLDSTRPERVPSPVDLIVVKVGDNERVAYRAGAQDLELGGPIVSPDGTRLAFLKVEQIGADFRKKIYAMDVDGSDLRALVELAPPPDALKGANIGPSQLAWSHDNQKMLLAETARTARSEQSRLRSLILLDLPSGRTDVLLSSVRRRIGGGPVITSQAWAPDGRRFVYMSDDSHVMVFDTVSRTEQDLGPGSEPTWSPDGRFIATQIPIEKGRRRPDHLLVSPDPPYQRTLLLSNARTLFSSAGLGYSGAALWFPDGRFLMVYHYPGERGYPHVLDRVTGEIAKLPPRFVGWSWGGKP